MILFLFAVIGMTHIIVDSEIMEPVERWFKPRLPAMIHHGLFECHQCSGFWCGVVLGPLVTYNPLMLFTCGCAGSFLAQLGYFTLNYLEAKSKP